jgi:hypothetical protein
MPRRSSPQEPELQDLGTQALASLPRTRAVPFELVMLLRRPGCGARKYPLKSTGGRLFMTLARTQRALHPARPERLAGGGGGAWEGSRGWCLERGADEAVESRHIERLLDASIGSLLASKLCGFVLDERRHRNDRHGGVLVA